MKHQSIYNRLRRIEGQIRGIEEMLNKERPEQEIIIQLEAAKSSMSSALVALIETMFEEEDGKILLSPEKAYSILKILKK